MMSFQSCRRLRKGEGRGTYFLVKGVLPVKSLLDSGDGQSNPSHGARGGGGRVGLPMNQNLSVDCLQTGELVERPCGDLLAPHLRKCEGNMEVLVTDV